MEKLMCLANLVQIEAMTEDKRSKGEGRSVLLRCENSLSLSVSIAQIKCFSS